MLPIGGPGKALSAKEQADILFRWGHTNTLQQHPHHSFLRGRGGSLVTALYSAGCHNQHQL